MLIYLFLHLIFCISTSITTFSKPCFISAIFSLESYDAEVQFVKKVKINRLQLKRQLLEVFKQDDINNYHLKVTLIDCRGKEEEGSGVGVLKETFLCFFTEFFSGSTTGRSQRVPSVRHGMSKEEWSAVARIFVAAKKIDYFPLQLSQAFVIAALLERSV